MNTIVISLDCVRTEALSCYPESFPFRHRTPYRADTPNIDSIASDGIIFHNAFCQAPFTPASHASLFTGQNPYRHGIRGMFNYKLNDDVETMAERFSEVGYDTAGFIGAHALSSRYGLNRGFGTYDEEFNSAYKNWIVGNRRPCEEVSSKALNWLDGRDSEFLLFLHYFDAHDGGDTPAEDKKSIGDNGGDTGSVRDIYNSYLRSLDEAVGSPGKRVYRTLTKLDPNKEYGRRYHLKQVQRIDEQIGRLVDALHNSGEYEETTIVILADHGDSFGDHGEYGHRKYIYDTTVHVPLIVKPTKTRTFQRSDYEGIVRLIDVYPTLAEAADIDIGSVEGASLYRAVTHESDRKAYAETRFEQSPEDFENLVTDLVGLRGNRWKIIRDRLDSSHELYDIKNDPEEHQNLADEHPAICDDLTAKLDDMLANTPDKEDNLMTGAEKAAIEEHLEGLGYL